MLHPATEKLLSYFDYEHLRDDDLKAVSRKFHDLAHAIAPALTGAEATVALRKLLEAKDAAVRAGLDGVQVAVCMTCGTRLFAGDPLCCEAS